MGKWRRVVLDGVKTAEIRCPKCGGIVRISNDPDRGHEIDADGMVTPSLVCPRVRCDFHETVMLEDWTAGG